MYGMKPFFTNLNKRTMDTGIRDFCVKYKEKLKNDKDIKETQLDFFRDFRDRISFNVNMYTSCPNTMWSFGYNRQNLFTLDSEDLKYLYDKYSKKIEAELKENVAKVKESYKDALNGL